MQYYTTTATGDAGVFYLGHWITKNFRWPFRVMSSDIGIDGETELLDDEDHSESIFIKIQVKTTTQELDEDFKYPLENTHLNYWLRSMAPVLFCVVELSTQNVYFKNISCLDDIEFEKKKYNISFNKTNDLLTIESKNVLRNSFRANMQEPFSIMDEILDKLKTIGGKYSSVEVGEKDLQKVRELIKSLETVEEFNRMFSWKFGKKGQERLDFLKSSLNSASNEINRELTEMSHY